MAIAMEQWLPLFFVFVMGLALLLYVILDGYDLGIGILLPFANDQEKDEMISTIGPFWDANETWIVLGVGVLLIAFPKAHGMVLTALYLPATLMLIGLILRGVAFDFRVKAQTEYKAMWNWLFFTGSLLAALAQGWMLGIYVMGLNYDWVSLTFALGIGLTLPAVYIMLGCGWLFVKTSGKLYDKAACWARLSIWPMGLALFLVSIATPIVSSSIAAKWFSLPAAIGLFTIPLTTIVTYFGMVMILRKPNILNAGYGWLIFAGMVIICVMAALGLAYSIYPDIVIGKLTIRETASSIASLKFVFYGVVVAVPMILLYTAYVYRVFRGKAGSLNYES